MSGVIRITIALSCIVEILSQTCKLINTEYNQVTIAQGETFTLELNKYFTGDALQYSLSSNSGFTQINQPWGPGQIPQGTIISVTAMTFNSNPNLYTNNYYALVSSGNNYLVYSSSQYPDKLTQITFGTSLTYVTITGATCYQIDSIQNQLVVTCSQTSTNYLAYYFIDLSAKQISSIITTNAISTTATVETQIGGNYIATGYTGTTSGLYVYNAQNTSQLVQISVALNLGEGDVLTGISLPNNNYCNIIVFISTDLTGIQVFDLSQTSKTTISGTQIMNPFSSGTLGLSTYNIDYASNYYYIAILGTSGIITTIYNPYTTYAFNSEQLFYTQQISSETINQTQIYLNARYLIVANPGGVSVYPSILNDINDGLQLFYYNTSSTVSAFDSYNNILVSINTNGAYTYQFNNPAIQTIQNTLTTSTTLQSFNITATSINYDVYAKNATQVTCSLLTLYYQVVLTPTSAQSTIYQQYYFTGTNSQQYYQQGQQFDFYFGSTQLINLNMMFIGPAIFAQTPQVQPAQSNIMTKTYSTLLSVPTINSPYKVNSYSFNGDTVYFSKIFYDPSFIATDSNTDEFQDSYLQLVQLSQNIVLYQCQALNNQCKQLYYTPYQGLIPVQDFALSIYEGSIYFVYQYSVVNVQSRVSEPTISVFQLTPNSAAVNGYTVQNQTYTYSQEVDDDEGTTTTYNVDIVQIALIKSNFYTLLTITENDNNVITTYNSLYVDSVVQLVNDDYETNEQEIILADTTQIITSFYYNTVAYGDVIFLNTYSASTNLQTTTTTYTYYLLVANCNSNQNPQIISSTMQVYQSTTQQAITYGFTIDGIYVINVGQKKINFYPRIDIVPILFINGAGLTTQNIPIAKVTIPLYNITEISQVSYSARYLYVLAQQTYQHYLYVYKNTGTILNSLYYIITGQNSQIDATLQVSVTSGIQYDAILYKQQGNYRYTNSYILPEFEIAVSCNLNSNSNYQVEYNYLGLKVGSLLSGAPTPSTSTEKWVSFQITNLITFVSEINTQVMMYKNGSSLLLNNNGQIYLDPRTLFSGNINQFLLTNSSYQNGYYVQMSQTVQSQPQYQIYQNGVTATSAVVYYGSSYTEGDTTFQVGQYWSTFVQTDHLVYVTPYMYYSPQDSNFADNSTVKISYPLTYKLPVLDIAANSQTCPLIFVDSLTQNVVSVCGSKVNGKFLASFTLFNTQTQQVLDTQVIDLNSAFDIEVNSSTEISANYILQNAVYLEIGIVVLQYRYSYNFGSQPPTDIILPFLYSASNMKNVNNTNGNLGYQLIQPLNSVYYIPNQNIASLYSVTPFSISTGTLTKNTQSITFGLLCVSDTSEECLTNTLSSTQLSTGVVITVPFSVGYGTFFAQTTSTIVNIYPANNKNQNIVGTITTSTFEVSLFNVLAEYSINKIQQIVQVGQPTQLNNDVIIYVPFIVVSLGNAYTVQLSFYQTNGQFIQARYACSLEGLTTQNTILQVSTQSIVYNNSTLYQVVAVVSNPTTLINNQVTLLNYGIINDWCLGLTESISEESIVTAIGSFTYQSVESTPVLSLMFPPLETSTNYSSVNVPLSYSPRTLISNNKNIQLLDTSPVVTISVYPDYTMNGGVTLATLNLLISGIQVQISAQPITTYINYNQVKGEGGSTLLILSYELLQHGQQWDRDLGWQYGMGAALLVIIVGTLGYLFYMSRSVGNMYE